MINQKMKTMSKVKEKMVRLRLFRSAEDGAYYVLIGGTLIRSDAGTAIKKLSENEEVEIVDGENQKDIQIKCYDTNP